MSNRLGQTREIKVCESCGNGFGCGANFAGCWCNGVTLDPSAAADIKAKFNDCLCPKCLEKFPSKGAKNMIEEERVEK